MESFDECNCRGIGQAIVLEEDMSVLGNKQWTRRQPIVFACLCKDICVDECDKQKCDGGIKKNVMEVSGLQVYERS